MVTHCESTTLNHQWKSYSVRKSAKSILQRRLKRPIFSHRCSECAVVVHHPNCETRVVDHSLVSCGSYFLRDVTYTTHIYGKFALHNKKVEPHKFRIHNPCPRYINWYYSSSCCLYLAILWCQRQAGRGCWNSEEYRRSIEAWRTTCAFWWKKEGAYRL